MSLAVEDVLAIQQLAARYNHSFDAGDGAAFASLFVTDGVLDSGPGSEPVKGAEALSAFATQVAPAMPGIRHVLTNAVIEGEGDDASMKGYLLVTVKGETGPSPMVTGVYTDQVTRQDGRWLFVQRTFAAD